MNPFTVLVIEYTPDNIAEPTRWNVLLEFQHSVGQITKVPITVFRYEIRGSTKSVDIITQAVRSAIVGQVIIACGQTPNQDWFDSMSANPIGADQS